MELIYIGVLNTPAEKHPGLNPGRGTMKVYGPYLRPDGRQHVCIVYGDGSKRTVSYPKYLMEQHLNRELEHDEIVHHIDGDFTNNAFENLEVLTRTNHAIHHGKDNIAKYLHYVCGICNEAFSIEASKVKHNQNTLNRAGPFCSKKCAGRYGAEVQNGRQPSAVSKQVYYDD